MTTFINEFFGDDFEEIVIKLGLHMLNINVGDIGIRLVGVDFSFSFFLDSILELEMKW